ncbi:unnamed protein product [Lactuca virosa]|uniref:Pentatricopeptide repeat-containing protein n=1 Tax=Lactuca virosa TaxID=75947 RepID=A0AAU9LBD4_9ASTR|nr:unnamed protein product [Lactuca virosa]
MANSKNVVWFMIYHPLNKFKFKGNFFTHSSLGSSRSPSALVEVGTGITAVASFHSNSCSSRRRSIFHRITNCDDALDMFHEITHRQPLPPVARFNELLQAVTKKKHYSCSVEIFQRMNSVGAPIDALTISIVIKCLCQMHSTREGFAVLGYGYKCGVVPDVFTFSALLDGLILEDKVPEAYAFFKKLIRNKVCDPNGVMYTNMIKGLC